MKTKLIIAAVFIFTVILSCNNKTKQDNKAYETYAITDLEQHVPAKLKGTTEENKQIPVGKFSGLNADSLATPTPNAATAYVDWDKKIIKTATLRLEIKDFKKYNNYVHGAAKQYGGYIAQEEQNLSDEKLETVITIKVPVAQFENLMNGLPADDAKVLERRISTDDVGGEIADTRSRLEAKKQMRLKYLEFLKQSKNMTEVLQVQNEIDAIQEQIESAAGRMNFLSHQSAYSTINLNFYQPLLGYKSTDTAPSFLTRVTGSFKTGMSWIKELIIGITAVWPLLLIAAGGYFFWKNIRRKKIILLNTEPLSDAV